jgi:ribokinase
LHKGANHHAPSTDGNPDLSNTTHLLLQNEIPLASTLSYLRAAHSAGIASIFNPSPMPTDAELRDFPWHYLTWLIVNEGELADLLKAVDGEQEVNKERGDFAPARKMMRSFASAEGRAGLGLICTLGARGILYLGPGERVAGYLPAAKVVNGVVDTTGAGDCFTGYFAAGLMRDEDLETTLQTCLTVSGSFRVRKLGCGRWSEADHPGLCNVRRETRSDGQRPD